MYFVSTGRFRRQYLLIVISISFFGFSGVAICDASISELYEQVGVVVHERIVNPVADEFEKYFSRFSQALLVAELDKAVVESIPDKKDQELLGGIFRDYENKGSEYTKSALLDLHKRYPASPIPFLVLSIFSSLEADYSNALIMVDKALELDEGLAFSQYWKANLLIISGRIEDAEQVFVRLRDMYPRALQTRYVQALLYWHNGQQDLAVSSLEKLVKAFPEDNQVHYSLSMMLYEQARYKKSLNVLDVVLPFEFDEKWGDAYLFKMRLLGNMGRRKGVQAYYERVFRGLDTNRYKSLGRVLLANILRDKEGLASAAKLIQREFPDDEEFNWIVFNAYLEAGDYPAATTLLAQLNESEPDSALIDSQRGRLALKQERYDKAVEWFSKAIVKEPNTAEYYYNLGSSYDLSYQYQKAIQHYEHALSLFPEDYFLRRQLGKILRYERDYSRAVKEYQKAIVLDPAGIAAKIGIGHTYIDMGEWDKAEEYYQLVIAAWPATYEGYWGMALVSQGRGDNRALEKWARKAIRSDSGQSIAYRFLATAQFNKGKSELAKETCLSIQKKVAAGSSAQKDLGACYLAIEEPELALSAYRKSITIHPTRDALYSSAYAYHLLGLYEESITFYNKALVEDPGNPEYLFGIAGSYDRLGRFDKALEYLRRVERIDPDRYDVAISIGPVYEEMGSNDQARAAFAKAISLRPNDDEPYFRAGKLEIRLEQYERAIDLFLKALERDDSQGIYYELLVLAYQMAGQTDKAVDNVEMALQRGMGSVPAYVLMGDVLNIAEHYADAVPVYLQAESMEAVTPDDQYKIDLGLGRAYVYLGKNEKAIPYLEHAIKSKVDKTAADDSSSYNLVGRAYASSGWLDKGLKMFMRAAELEPESSVPLNSVGYTYYLKKDYKTAISWYEKSLAAPDRTGATGIASYNMALAYYAMRDKQKARKYLDQSKAEGYPGSPKFEAALRN